MSQLNERHCISLSIAVLVLFAWTGFAQVVTISGTISGSPLPVDGTVGIEQAMDSPRAVLADGGGGFYVVSAVHRRSTASPRTAFSLSLRVREQPVSVETAGRLSLPNSTIHSVWRWTHLVIS